MPSKKESKENDFQKEIFHQYFQSNKYDELFSKICYRSPTNQLVCQYIEPLIGLLRDPLTICSFNNIPLNLQINDEVAMQSKRFAKTTTDTG